MHTPFHSKCGLQAQIPSSGSRFSYLRVSPIKDMGIWASYAFATPYSLLIHSQVKKCPTRSRMHTPVGVPSCCITWQLTSLVQVVPDVLQGDHCIRSKLRFWCWWHYFWQRQTRFWLLFFPIQGLSQPVTYFNASSILFFSGWLILYFKKLLVISCFLFNSAEVCLPL